MRNFHSYGPVSCKHHFCVARNDLIKQCTEQLVGDLQEGGHYFTIWAPRQNGKTWLVQEVQKRVDVYQKADFITGVMSMQGVILKDEDPAEKFLSHVPLLVWETFGLKVETPSDWGAFKQIFSRQDGLFKQPVILFIDEFDSLPAKVIDMLVTLFRDMYLKHNNYQLHGLALIGVRAVLGVGSDRGSPFNIQRALHVPNFTSQEVHELFKQYQDESGQEIVPEVTEQVYESTCGQPGLVCWFGELLTEKYNPGDDKPIDMRLWKKTYRGACAIEWNNTVLNIIKKAGAEYLPYVLKLFSKSDIRFSLRADWCGYLYLNGIIDYTTVADADEEETYICRFSSPFVQECLYEALMYEITGDEMPILALAPLDDLADVFEKDVLDLPALLQRYKDYLARLKAEGLNPWKDQPRRADLHLTEAVGHFHLYAWLLSAVARQCTVSPEFPTGNGKVDIRLKCGLKSGIIEIKSFTDAAQVKEAKNQAAEYAMQTGLNSVTVALFVPSEDEEILAQLSGEVVIEKANVSVCAIGWV